MRLVSIGERPEGIFKILDNNDQRVGTLEREENGWRVTVTYRNRTHSFTRDAMNTAMKAIADLEEAGFF